MFNQRRSIPQPEGPTPQSTEARENFPLDPSAPEAYLAIPEVIQHPAQGTRRNHSWRWLMISLLSCCATSAAAFGAFLWLVNLPPTVNCDNTATVTSDRAQLYCAQSAAGSGELEDVLTSLDLVSAWAPGHPLHYEVQPLVEQWSWVALKAAEQELRKGQLDQAKALIGRIPDSSPVYADGQGALAGWNTEWAAGSALMAKAEAALQNQDWGTASAQVLALAELQNPHWRVEQVQALSRQIQLERQAQTLLTQAVATASPGGSDRLGQAIRTASQIDQGTFTHAAAQAYLDRWSDLLLKQGLDHWYASDLNQAIALGRAVALNPSRAKAAQELIWLSQSRQMAQQSLGTWRTSPDQLVTLYKAMLLANRLPVDSPYYGQAQSSVATWRTHLEDLGQLQTAQIAGRVNHLSTLNLAITQAEKIPLGHPRRVQAQTMVAHWRQEVERLEDRPYLIKAHQLASAKTIDGLRSAIEAAKAIALNRALRHEAQSWIYVWTNQIQTIEDRPLLNRARNLAERGQLSQAIAEASSVKAGRALYGEAQVAITDWQRQIWTQDQARQRAAQRALARSQTLPTSVPEGIEPNTENAASLTPTPTPDTAPNRLAPALAPVNSAMPQRRSPLLPSRIETVPGANPATPDPVAAPAPLMGTPVTPVDLPTPPSLTAPAPLAPTSPAPLPVDIPAPPAPAIPTPPIIDLPPTDSSVLDSDTQSTVPTSPAVSTRPQPEQIVTPQPTDVLYTGALYLGR
jgi:hypothetical protein